VICRKSCLQPKSYQATPSKYTRHQKPEDQSRLRSATSKERVIPSLSKGAKRVLSWTISLIDSGFDLILRQNSQKAVYVWSHAVLATWFAYSKHCCKTPIVVAGTDHRHGVGSDAILTRVKLQWAGALRRLPPGRKSTSGNSIIYPSVTVSITTSRFNTSLTLWEVSWESSLQTPGALCQELICTGWWWCISKTRQTGFRLCRCHHRPSSLGLSDPTPSSHYRKVVWTLDDRKPSRRACFVALKQGLSQQAHVLCFVDGAHNCWSVISVLNQLLKYEPILDWFIAEIPNIKLLTVILQNPLKKPVWTL